MIPYVLGSNDHIKGYEFYTSNPVLFYPPIVCLLVPFDTPERDTKVPSKHYANDPYIRPDHMSPTQTGITGPSGVVRQ